MKGNWGIRTKCRDVMRNDAGMWPIFLECAVMAPLFLPWRQFAKC